MGYKGGPCAFIKEQDECQGLAGSMINFYEMYYCGFESTFCSSGKKWFFLPVLFLFLAIAMYNLGSTADLYLSPALEHISERLHFSESLAGVTLLALGNGAPDVFAAISAAGGGDKSDILLTVSALTGSALFITTVVMFLSLNAASNDPKAIRVTSKFFLRDLFFFFLTIIGLLLAMLVFEEINFYVSGGFICLYFIFVIVVVIQAKTHLDGDTNEELLDHVDAKAALDFTEMIH